MEMTLEFELSEHEKKVRNDELVKKLKEKKDAELARKVAMGEQKKVVDGLDADINLLRIELETNKMSVKCEIVYNKPEPGKRTILRKDTYSEIVDDMSPEEKKANPVKDPDLFDKKEEANLPENPPEEPEEAKILELPAHEPADRSLKLFRDSDETEIWAHYTLEELKATWVDEWADEVKAAQDFDEMVFTEIPEALLDEVRTDDDGDEVTFRVLLEKATEPGKVWENPNA